MLYSSIRGLRVRFFPEQTILRVFENFRSSYYHFIIHVLKCYIKHQLNYCTLKIIAQIHVHAHTLCFSLFLSSFLLWKPFICKRNAFGLVDINWGLVSVIKPLFPDKSRNEAKFTGPHKISALWSSRNSGSSTLLMPSVILPLDLSVQLTLAFSSSSCGGLSPLMLKSMDLSTSTVCEVLD